MIKIRMGLMGEREHDLCKNCPKKIRGPESREQVLGKEISDTYSKERDKNQ